MATNNTTNNGFPGCRCDGIRIAAQKVVKTLQHLPKEYSLEWT